MHNQNILVCLTAFTISVLTVLMVTYFLDSAWAIITRFADGIMEPDSPFEPITPLTKLRKQKKRTVSARFSFTRSVSRDVFERQSSRGELKDGCTPIIILDTNEILDGLQKASYKRK